MSEHDTAQLPVAVARKPVAVAEAVREVLQGLAAWTFLGNSLEGGQDYATTPHRARRVAWLEGG